MKKITFALFLFAVALTAVGCSSGGSDAPADPPPLTQEEIDLAGRVYSDQACTLCHGDSGEGSEGGPALRGLAPYWTVDRLVTYLKDPPAFRKSNRDFDNRRDVDYELEMPAYDHMTETELQALARWLMSRP